MEIALFAMLNCLDGEVSRVSECIRRDQLGLPKSLTEALWVLDF